MDTISKIEFRVRDNVNISYEVRGIEGSKQFPYVNDLPTLKEAVTIGRKYPGVYGDGAATHIIRRYAKKYPDGHEFHHSSGYTHRWRVDSNGRLQLIIAYNRNWPTTRIGPVEFAEHLPFLASKATTLQGQLLDLATVAKGLGLCDASKALEDHVFGRTLLPEFAKQPMIKESIY